MPAHDWSRIFADGFHHFHQLWTALISNSLNGGVLPKGYYAAIEQVVNGPEPDVVALEASQPDWDSYDRSPNRRGNVMVLERRRPPVRFSFPIDEDKYAAKANLIAIKHVSHDQTVAIIEIVSPGNKHSHRAFDQFTNKLWTLMEKGIHLLVVDLFRPTSKDPFGLPAVLWGSSDPRIPHASDSEPLTLTACCSDSLKTGYVDLLGFGATLPDMPLFLTVDRYVDVPLEQTYQEAWRGVPEEWKEIVEGRAAMEAQT